MVLILGILTEVLRTFVTFHIVNAIYSGILFVLITRLTAYRFTWKMMLLRMSTHSYLAPYELFTGTTWEFFAQPGSEIF